MGPWMFAIIVGSSFGIGCAFMAFIQTWDEAVHSDPDADSEVEAK
jgi:hypothetical protein